jgi:hypothetical protein
MKPTKADPQQILQFLTTEHFTLQTAKAATIAEANGRSTLYLASVSSAVVALAFIGQVSQVGQSFFIFGLVLLPALLFLGLFTFERILQVCIEDIVMASGINRIRHYYIEMAPEVKPYFIRSSYDDIPGIQLDMGIAPSPWQLVLTNAGMIGVINSILASVFSGLLARFTLSTPIYLSLGLGLVIFGLNVWAYLWYQAKKFKEMASRLHPRFPAPPTSPKAE